MKPIRNFQYGMALSAGAMLLSSGTLRGAPFLYSSGDLLLAFRQTGNAVDYVVNIGKATNFSSLPPGTTLLLTNLAAAQLNTAFPSLNHLTWSVAGAVRSSSDPTLPIQTLWVSAPRTDPAAEAAPWLRKGQFVQGNAASQIDALGNNAAAASSAQPAGPNNTASGVAIPANSDYAVGLAIGEGGNYANTFQGTVENTTPDGFVDQPGSASRSDLYELRPGTSTLGTLNSAGQYLGYFELKPDGTLVFSNASPVSSSLTIAGIQRLGDVTTITFPTVKATVYSLLSTDPAGLASPLAAWSDGPSLTGTGEPAALQVTNTASILFFVIKAQP